MVLDDDLLDWILPNQECPTLGLIVASRGDQRGLKKLLDELTPVEALTVFRAWAKANEEAHDRTTAYETESEWPGKWVRMRCLPIIC